MSTSSQANFSPNDLEKKTTFRVLLANLKLNSRILHPMDVLPAEQTFANGFRLIHDLK